MPTITCPPHRPTPLSELPTGKDGLLQRAHCPHKVTDRVNNNKINSASQVLEFDGNRFLHKGILIRDSLNTIFNHE